MKNALVRLACIAFLFCAAVTVHAEQVEFNGVGLPVTELTPVDDKNVKIKIFNKSDIIGRDLIEMYVLAAYLENKEASRKLGGDLWRRVAENALKAEDAQVSALALLIYGIISGPAGTEYFNSLFFERPAMPGLARRIADFNQFSSLDSGVRNVVLLAAGVEDFSWLRSNFLGKLLANDEFPRYAEERYVQALKVKDITAAKKIAALLETIYVARVDRYKKFQTAAKLIGELEAEKGDLSNSQLLTLLSLRNTDASLRTVLDPFLIDGFHVLASQALQKGKADDALIVISSINSDQATPTTYQLLDKILQQIKLESRAFSNESVQNLLMSAAAGDEKLKARIEKVHYDRVIAMVKQFRFSDAEKSIADLKKTSPGSPFIEELKLELALGLLRAKESKAAADVLEERTGRLTSYDRFRLFLEGYYGDPLIFVLLVLVPLVLKLIYELISKTFTPAPAPEPNEEPAQTQPAAEVEEQPAASFITSGRSKRQNPLMDEYLECLKKFDLEKGTDLKDIKMAYRNAVRKIHPDLNASRQSPEDASQFVDLTKTYDRIRELHRLLGFGG